ncbi:hypothetical protein [Methylophilus sp. QUAN]|uniref:recombination directionality factor n=1 Tax=Methylophilus sp. QUAN TaxID=2781020 RepID=UPI0018909230|nr:hypothetical protein [Methylophilus sp. QUAN]MBF4991053.1 hypothetical protein [Methylophilus sp. QUAN]
MTTPKNFFIKGLAITTPILGRISIGHREEKNGKVLPVRDDEISITSQVRRGMEYTPHPIEAELLNAVEAKANAEKKLRSIPVKLMYNNPELNIQAGYSAFESSTGRQLCVGDGVKARRYSKQDNKTNEVECNGPQYCEFAQTYRCKLHARLNVQIDGQDDPMGAFVFRTSGYNSVRTLIYKLQGFYSLFNGKLRGIPLSLVMRAKSTAQSMGQPVYYLDLVLRGKSPQEAMQIANETAKAEADAGMSQAEFEDTMMAGLKNSAFLETEEDGIDIVEEFFNENDDYTTPAAPAASSKSGGLNSLQKVLPNKNNEAKQSAGQTQAQSGTLEPQQSPVEITMVSDVSEMSLTGFQLPPEIAEQFSTNTQAS